MNKSEFISAVAEKSGLSKVDAKKAVEAFVDTVSNELKEGVKSLYLASVHSLCQRRPLVKVLTRKLKKPLKSQLARP